MFLVSICNYSGAQRSDTYGIFHLIVFNYNDYVVSHLIKCFPYVRYNKSTISPSAFHNDLHINTTFGWHKNVCVLGLHRPKHKHLILYPWEVPLISAGLWLNTRVCRGRRLFISSSLHRSVISCSLRCWGWFLVPRCEMNPPKLLAEDFPASSHFYRREGSSEFLIMVSASFQITAGQIYVWIVFQTGNRNGKLKKSENLTPLPKKVEFLLTQNPHSRLSTCEIPLFLVPSSALHYVLCYFLCFIRIYR